MDKKSNCSSGNKSGSFEDAQCENENFEDCDDQDQNVSNSNKLSIFRRNNCK